MKWTKNFPLTSLAHPEIASHRFADMGDQAPFASKVAALAYDALVVGHLALETAIGGCYAA